MVDRMRADHEAHRQRLAGGGARLVDRAQIARRDQIDAGFACGRAASAGACRHWSSRSSDRPRSRSRRRYRARRRRRAARCTGSVVRSASSPVSTTCCTGASARETSKTSGLLRSRRSTSGSSSFGLTPKAARDPRAAAGDVADQFLPARGRPRGTAPPWDCLRGMAATSARSIGSLTVSSSSRQRLRRSGAGGSGRHRPASTALRPVSFQRCPFLRCPVAVFGAVDYSQTRGCNHKRCPRPIGNGVAQGAARLSRHVPGLTTASGREKSPGG